MEDKLNRELKCNYYNKFEVINLGVSNYDIKYVVNRMIKRGIKYNPDLVLWLIIEDDFNRINEYRIPRIRELEKFGMINFDPKTGQYSSSIQTYKDTNELFSKEFILQYQKNALSELIQQYKGELIILSFPSLNQKYKNIIQQAIKVNANYSYYDNIPDIFEKAYLRLLDGHPNRGGHKKIAEDIFSYLTNNILTGCTSSRKN